MTGHRPDTELPAPDRDLQQFGRLRHYFKTGRAPWIMSEAAIVHIADVAEDGDISVSTPDFGAALRDRFASEMAYEATNGLADRSPRSSARQLFAPRDRLILAIAIVLGATFLIFSWRSLGFALLGLASLFFCAVALLRLSLVLFARRSRAAPRRKALSEAELPMLTILAPLFRERHALPGLIRAIDNLDYPRDRIDVKLLLEASDRETIAEARRLRLDQRFDLVILPKSHPQTKPKACNYGLMCARGDLIVIYDAEDEPERGQLRMAAEIFAADETLACVQARLNFYNPDENWLTALFTLEYCLWFDHMLPALDRLRAPIPLGGTSNIFRTDILAAVGGWDPYNVTEDADLGLRLAARGHRTTVIPSTTFEEANCALGNWMRQRSRWMKGYMQSWLVHRRSGGLAKGWRHSLAVDFFVGGAAFAALANPLLILMWAASLLAPASQPPLLPAAIGNLCAASVLAGNLIFIGLAAYAPLRRRLARLSPFALFSPIYWLMMSAAAYLALFQLATRPSFWEKTVHGLSQEAQLRRRLALEFMGLD